MLIRSLPPSDLPAGTAVGNFYLLIDVKEYHHTVGGTIPRQVDLDSKEK